MSERSVLNADIVCVGFGPASAGFLYTLSNGINETVAKSNDNGPACAPPQVICYERANDVAFGVSGVVTLGRAMTSSIGPLHEAQIPMLAPVTSEKLAYLMDPVGASRRGVALRLIDGLLKFLQPIFQWENQAVEMPFLPAFLRKQGGYVFSLGQFCQWIGAKVLETGQVQIWPGTPVAQPLFEGNRVKGVRLVDQGTDAQGNPTEGYLPGMDVESALTVIGDGPVGSIGDQIDRKLGLPEDYQRNDWAIGMKIVVELPQNTELKPGLVVHTFGYPEPGIFGFLYVHPERLASAGIFVPSWMDNPVRTAYRYLQHWMLHPYLWRWFQGGTLRSWGAKSLQESGKRAEPILVGDGYARIGEGSGTTNILTGSGVDEAWSSGVLLGEAVLRLWRENKPYSRQNLEQTYVQQRQSSWLEKEAKIARNARDGFHCGIISGLLGMGLAGLTRGRIGLPFKPKANSQSMSLEAYCRGHLSSDELRQIRKECETRGMALHDAIMDRCGWPAIPFDGKLLVSHQDALLLGGKVQAPPGYADHVVFWYPNLCEQCGTRICIEMCSGQAIMPGPEGRPHFEREKCIHCGACFWSCVQVHPQDPRRGVVDFRAGTGGLHSAEN